MEGAGHEEVEHGHRSRARGGDRRHARRRPPGAAKRGDVLVRGTCTQSSTSKLKLSDEDGRIEVELEVDQNRNGVPWLVAISHDGRRVVRMRRVTRPPSGSFEARVVLRNRPGRDVVAARAVSRSGEVCTARARF